MTHRSDTHFDLATAGDSDAMAHLWRAHRGWLAALLLAHAPRGIEVEDLLQDVSVTFVGELRTIRNENSLRPWLRAVAINAARSAARKMIVRGITKSLDETEKMYPQTAAELTTDTERTSSLMERIATLPLEQREPLLLQATHNLSQREIADILGISESAVESRLARARRTLREQLLPIAHATSNRNK